MKKTQNPTGLYIYIGKYKRCVYLTWQCSRVKTPYRNTKRPTRAAGNSIPVYQPSQAKYRPIFSPKYLLKQQQRVI